MPTEEYLESVELMRELREIPLRMRKRMNGLALQMLLRTTVCFKDIGKFAVQGQGRPVYGDEYSGNHIAIFECELKVPPQLALIDHTAQEFINSYRLNFKNWKIVDVDNFMQGNLFFPKIEEEAIWDK